MALPYKIKIPGPTRENILFCIKLDKNFNYLDQKIRPIGNTLLFEFDVDIIGDKIVIFAVGMEDVVLAIVAPSEKKLIITSQIEKNYKEILISPSVLVTQKNIYYTVIESPRTHKAKVLIGKHPKPISEQMKTLDKQELEMLESVENDEWISNYSSLDQFEKRKRELSFAAHNSITHHKINDEVKYSSRPNIYTKGLL
jgi:histidyl-tRNA synthetase